MADKRADQLKEITERLEQGVKDIFTSEMYTKYLLTMSKFHNYSFNAASRCYVGGWVQCLEK